MVELKRVLFFLHDVPKTSPDVAERCSSGLTRNVELSCEKKVGKRRAAWLERTFPIANNATRCVPLHCALRKLAAAVLLIVEIVLLQQLVATLLKPALTPVLGPEFTLNVER